MENYAENHVLNTPKALAKIKGATELTAICFTGTSNIKVYCGYADGLICISDVTNSTNYEWRTLIGHTNKINNLCYELDQLFSASQDCTVRQWNVKMDTCTRVYKF